MLNNIEWGEGGNGHSLGDGFRFFFQDYSKIVFFEMCLNRFCARLHVVQFDLIKSKKPYVFTILENLSVKLRL